MSRDTFASACADCRRSEWAVLLRDHHKGFIDWETYEANQRRLASNTRPRPHAPEAP